MKLNSLNCDNNIWHYDQRQKLNLMKNKKNSVSLCLLLNLTTKTKYFIDFWFVDELTNIVKREMEKNKGLSDELAALRSAANVIESIQNETSGLQASPNKSIFYNDNYVFMHFLLHSFRLKIKF